MHNCIKCDYFEGISIAPKFQKYICPKCQTVQWIRHSRIDSMTYNEDIMTYSEGTIEVYEVNRTVKLKHKKVK